MPWPMREDAPSEKNTPLRVVLDTNVYYSALYDSESFLHALFVAGVQERKYRILASPFILHELHEKLIEKFLWEEPQALRVIKQIVHAVELVNPKKIPPVIVDDPDDNHILACALAGKADLIASGDRHLLSLKEYEGIPIVRPMDFLRTLGLSK